MTDIEDMSTMEIYQELLNWGRPGRERESIDYRELAEEYRRRIQAQNKRREAR